MGELEIREKKNFKTSKFIRVGLGEVAKLNNEHQKSFKINEIFDKFDGAELDKILSSEHSTDKPTLNIAQRDNKYRSTAKMPKK